jgi:hypothetical protein
MEYKKKERFVARKYNGEECKIDISFSLTAKINPQNRICVESKSVRVGGGGKCFGLHCCGIKLRLFFSLNTFILSLIFAVADFWTQ